MTKTQKIVIVFIIIIFLANTLLTKTMQLTIQQRTNKKPTKMNAFLVLINDTQISFIGNWQHHVQRKQIKFVQKKFKYQVTKFDVEIYRQIHINFIMFMD